MFFQQKTNQHKTKATELAIKLHAAIATRKKVRMSDEWVKWLQILLKKQPDAEAVLIWYCKNIDEPFVPLAVSAKEFKDKFDAIKTAMSRDDSLVELSPKDSDFAERMKQQYRWPIEIRNALPLLTQRSRQGIDRFVTVLRKFCGTERDVEFLDRIEDAYVPDLLLSWFLALNESYNWIEHYHGPVTKLAFGLDLKRFKDSFWNSWCVEWCGQEKAFDDLYNTLLQQWKEEI